VVITAAHEVEKHSALAFGRAVAENGAMQRRAFLRHGLTTLGALSAGAVAKGCRAGSACPKPTIPNPTIPDPTNPDPTMNLTIRRSAARGHADHGWLDSRHTFSFADYHDPAHMGFRSLRVINQDRVQPGRGFPTHPHRDMEIFSYVLEGSLEHKDSMGNGRVLRPGEIQLMSAGTGVTHSEFNPDRERGLHFLQIWIQPARRGLLPSYTEWKPGAAAAKAPNVVVISPDGRDGSAVIHQDAVVHRLRLAAGAAVEHEVAPGRGVWVQLISGRMRVGESVLEAGDGASTETPGILRLAADEALEALLFDLG
jgi:quercetin 2,3-dioxygenase